MSKYKHTLVIGGTGMLAKATRYLISESEHVSILGRSPLRLNAFIKNKNVRLINSDYKKENQFLNQIREQFEQYGTPNIFLCWMHSSGRSVFEQLIEFMSEPPTTEIYHVLGSASYDPEKTKKEWYKPNPNTNYNKVILGFKIDQGMSRWLFQEEISDGTIEAIRSKSKESILGQIKPWDMRP